MSTMVYSQQEIQDFYLSNYRDDGLKDWEVKGKEATVSDKYVEIEDMEGKYFQKNDTIDISSDRAMLDKENMDAHLESNVRINSTQGIRMKTESLDWKQSKNLLSTDQWVEVIREDSMRLEAKGLEADTKLQKANFKEDVIVDIIGDDTAQNVTKINCDGPLEIDYEQGVAVFKKNVVVDNVQGKMIADTATVYFDIQNKSIIKIIAEGDVKIIRDDNVTFAERATFLEAENKVILEGRPRLVIFPEQKQN